MKNLLEETIAYLTIYKLTPADVGLAEMNEGNK